MFIYGTALQQLSCLGCGRSRAAFVNLDKATADALIPLFPAHVIRTSRHLPGPNSPEGLSLVPATLPSGALAGQNVRRAWDVAVALDAVTQAGFDRCSWLGSVQRC